MKYIFYTLLLIACAWSTTAFADTSEMSSNYYLLNGYVGANVTGSPFSVDGTCPDISSYFLPCITGDDSGVNAPNMTWISPPSIAELKAEGWNLYFMSASEHSSTLVQIRPDVGNTSGGPSINSFSLNGTYANCDTGNVNTVKEVETNLFVAMVNPDCLETIFAFDSDDLLWQLGWEEAGCTGFCRYPIGAVWSRADVSDQILGLTTYEQAYSLLRGLILTSESGGSLTDTRIVNVNLPSPFLNTVTASTTVEFNVDYINGVPPATQICINLYNQTIGLGLTPLCQSTPQQGAGTIATSTVLNTGHTYAWSAYLYGPAETVIALSTTRFFTVVTSPTTSYLPSNTGYGYGELPSAQATSTQLSDLTLQCDPESVWFVESVCNLALLLFIPSQSSLNELDSSLGELNEKLPFSVFFEFKQGWDNAQKTQDVQPVSLTLTFFNKESEILSATTTEQFVGESALDTFRFLVAASLWVGFGFLAFRKVGSLFNN